MGGRGSKSGKSRSGSSAAQPAPQILGVAPMPTAQAAAAQNNANFSATDSAPFHELYGGRAYFDKQGFDIDQQIAMMNYVSPTRESGSMYSMSQNMNWALSQGQQLTANQQFVYDNIMGAMHNLGYNLNLSRGDHEGFANMLIQKAGLTGDYSKYSEKQLKQALVGMTYGENKLVSTSYNEFRNAPNTSDVFTSRVCKIKYEAPAATQAVMPGNGGGGALGEIILADSKGRENYRIKDVRYTGQKARRQGTQSYSAPQLEFVVEVIP